MAPQFFVFTCLLATFTFVTLVTVRDQKTSRSKQEGYLYLHKGVICFKCQPGTFVFRHCSSNFTFSDCDPCSNGTFQRRRTQAESCGKCKDYCHIKNSVVVKNCTSTSDMICQCKPGYFVTIFDQILDIRACKAFTPCKKGEVVTRNGTPTQDQRCSSCPDGMYASNGVCVNCTSCIEKNVEEITPCNSTADAVCNDGGSEPVSHLSSVIAPVVVGVVLAVVVTVVVLCKLKKTPEDKSTTETNNTIQLEQVVSGNSNSRTDQNSNKNGTLRSRKQSSLELSWSSGSNKIYKPGPRRTLPLTNQPESSEPLLGSTLQADSYTYNQAQTDHWVDDIFRLLYPRLGHDWQEFIRSLPGDREWMSVANNICCQAKEDHPNNVQESIYQALLKWKEQCPLHVTMRNIVRALSELQNPEEKKRVADHLVKRYNEILT